MPARGAPWTTTPRRDGNAAARGKPADRLVRDPRRADRARPTGAGRRAAAARRGACRARSRAGHDPLDAGRRCRRLSRVPRGPGGEWSRSITGAGTSLRSRTGRTWTRPATSMLRPPTPWRALPRSTRRSARRRPRRRRCRFATKQLGRVAIRVDAAADVGPVARPWRPCIGSEHLALLLDGPGPGNLPVGDDLLEAFRIVRAELGAEMVRAHGILHDRLGVYREEDGRPVHDFSRIDAALDRLLETGLRPIIELSFMPADLASDPNRTVFDYRGIISPPRDLGRWRDLVEALVRHLVDRHGRDEVARWLFEVWNEPNLQVFWTGTEADYFDLYDASAEAVKAVDPAFEVGGPSTSAVGWVDDLLEHARQRVVPLDFVSTHTYGAPPLDLRPIAGSGRPARPADLVDRMGRQPDVMAHPSTTAYGARRSSPAGCARLPAGCIRSRTGSRPTSSSSSVRRSACSMAGSACSRSETCASRASGPSGSSSSSAPARSPASSRATARAASSRHGRRATTTASRSPSGTERSTRARRTATPASAATSRCRSAASSPGRTCFVTGVSTRTIRTSTGCGRSSVTTTGPTTSVGSG